MVRTWCSTLSVNYTKRVRIVAWRQTSESRRSVYHPSQVLAGADSLIVQEP